MPKMSGKEIEEALDEALNTASKTWDSDYEGERYGEDRYDEDRYDSPGYRPGFATLLPDGRILECTMEEWAKVMATPRRIAQSNISGVVVSTVFIGVNFGLTAPLWFETLVLGGALDGLCDRYASLDDAVIGHDMIVTTIKEAIRDENARSKSNVERVRRHNVVR
jgi:hypothetical protein